MASEAGIPSFFEFLLGFGVLFLLLCVLARIAEWYDRNGRYKIDFTSGGSKRPTETIQPFGPVNRPINHLIIGGYQPESIGRRYYDEIYFGG